MLQRLQINNFAIIEHAELEFAKGFNVITGETGAGKSILLDALNLLMGKRANADFIKQNAESAQLKMQFSDEAIVERVLSRGRKNVASINNQTQKYEAIHQFSATRLLIYGQQQNQNLLRNDEQRLRLDRFAQLNLAPLRRAFNHWRQTETRLQNYLQRKNDWEKQRELLLYQLAELEQIAPKHGEFTALNQSQKQLAAANEILHKGSQLIEWTENLNSQLKNIFKLATQLNQQNERFHETQALIEQALIYLQESLYSAQKNLDHIDENPEKLESIEKRMGVLIDLARKHRVTAEELPLLWERLQNNAMLFDENSEEELQHELNEAQDNYQREADMITAQRNYFAPLLADEVSVLLKELGMGYARFEVQISTAGASVFGCDLVQFLIAPNLGQDLQELQKIASGGELSRVSLALELATIADQSIETVIFDEVDSGIGGEIAHTIGKLLRRLGEKKQVICITHLPQVAVYANHHLAIKKLHKNMETISDIHPLNYDERIVEIARMLGDTERGRILAEELLKSAESNRMRFI